MDAKLPLMLAYNFRLIKYNSQPIADNNFILKQSMEYTRIPLLLY
jgi:hypothetical protein